MLLYNLAKTIPKPSLRRTFLYIHCNKRKDKDHGIDSQKSFLNNSTKYITYTYLPRELCIYNIRYIVSC